jgi:hypothetical protein
VPARGLSVRVVQAGKAFVLARFVLSGAEASVPALAGGHSAVSGTFAKALHPYVQLVNAFIAGERSAAGSAGAAAPATVFQTHRRTFENDGLLGMVLAAQDAARVHRVCGLSRSYVSLTTDAFGSFAKAANRESLLQTLRQICASNGALVVVSADDKVVSFDPSMTAAGSGAAAASAPPAGDSSATTTGDVASADQQQQQQQQELLEALIQGWGGEESGGYFSFFAPLAYTRAPTTTSGDADAAAAAAAATTPSQAALAAFAARPSPAGANTLEALQQTLEANTRVARYTEKLATSHGYLLAHTQGFHPERLPDPKDLRRQQRDLMGGGIDAMMMMGGGGGWR